eukprot:5189204-Prymnesium_polylepis.1
MLDAIRLGHEGVGAPTVCHDRARPYTPSIEGPRTASSTAGLARDRPPTCERQRQAVGKQCTAGWRAF